MKTLLTFLLSLLAVSGFAAGVTFDNFDTNLFRTNGYRVGVSTNTFKQALRIQHGSATSTNLSNGFTTNFTVYDTAGGAVTMRTNQFLSRSAIDYLIPDAGMYFTFSKVLQNIDYGNLFVNVTHDPGGPSGNTVEFQFSSSHFIALGMANGSGSGHLQFGIGNVDTAHQFGGNYLLMTSQPTTTATNGHSAALMFRAESFNGAGSQLSYKNPGIVAQVTSTNGPDSVYELDFFPDLNNSGGLGSQTTDGTWDVRTLKTNALRLVWNQRNPIELWFEGKGFFTNDFRTFGNTYFGSLANEGANDMFIDHTLHFVCIGDGFVPNFQIQNAVNTELWFRSSPSAGWNAFPIGGLSIGKDLAVTNGSALDVVGIAAMTVGITIHSNTLASIPALFPGDLYLYSSNGIAFRILVGPTGTRTTNTW